MKCQNEGIKDNINKDHSIGRVNIREVTSNSNNSNSSSNSNSRINNNSITSNNKVLLPNTYILNDRMLSKFLKFVRISCYGNTIYQHICSIQVNFISLFDFIPYIRSMNPLQTEFVTLKSLFKFPLIYLLMFSIIKILIKNSYLMYFKFFQDVSLKGTFWTSFSPFSLPVIITQIQKHIVAHWIFMLFLRFSVCTICVVHILFLGFFCRFYR